MLVDGFNKKKQVQANNSSPKQIKDINYIMQTKVSIINIKTTELKVTYTHNLKNICEQQSKHIKL